jgi:hypothetical protein
MYWNYCLHSIGHTWNWAFRVAMEILDPIPLAPFVSFLLYSCPQISCQPDVCQQCGPVLWISMFGHTLWFGFKLEISFSYPISIATSKGEVQPSSKVICLYHLFCSFVAYLWKVAKDLLQHHSKPKNEEEMIQTMQGIWDQVSLEQLQRLISNFSNRMQAILLAKGGSTRW